MSYPSKLDYGEQYEEIRHPDHYNWFGIECQDVIRHFNYNLGAAIKYIWRSGRKPGQDILKDLYKARESVNAEIEYWEKKQD